MEEGGRKEEGEMIYLDLDSLSLFLMVFSPFFLAKVRGSISLSHELHMQQQHRANTKRQYHRLSSERAACNKRQLTLYSNVELFTGCNAIHQEALKHERGV